MSLMSATGHRKITPEEFEQKRREMEQARERRERQEREAREHQKSLEQEKDN